MNSPRFFLFLSLTAVALLRSQSPLGTVTGVALDPQGAVVPSAQVTLRNTATGIVLESKTNAGGVYLFPNLNPGRYKLSATAAGFRGFETGEFALEAFRTIRQDIRFEIQAAATEVSVVEAVSGVVQLESPAVATSLSSKQILELPTNLRSVFNNAGDSGVIFQMLPLTIPGIVQVGAGAYWTAPGSGVAGVRVRVDGIETNFGNFGSPDPVSQPSMESLGEFTANIITNKAEFGGVSVVTSVTKTGSNDFHGNVFWYARNNALDARNTFSPARPFLNIHNFGTTFSGPIRRDRTFFHLTWDEARGSRPYIFAANVPTLAQREGDFSSEAALRNPFTADRNPIGPNNRLLPQFISSQARRTMERFFPLPNFGPANSFVGNYRAAFNGGEYHRILEGRVDHNWTPGHASFARYQFKDTDYDIPGARGPMPPTSVGTSTNKRLVHFATLGDVATLRPNLVNEARAGYVALDSSSSLPLTGDGLLRDLGISGLPARGAIPGIPTFGIAGYSTVNVILLNPVVDGRFQVSDNLSWNKGRHSLKFGGELVQWFVNRYMPFQNALYGNFSFTNRFTGNAFADFLLGLPTAVTRQDPFPTQYTRWKNASLFAQDDWKVTPKLTLSYGLRWEYNGAATLRHDNIYSFDLATGSIVIPNANARRSLSPYLPATLPVVEGDRIGYPRSLRDTDMNNVAPRFGFAYQPFNDSRTVIRGGWGVYYVPYSGAVTGTLATGPYAVSTTSNNQIVNGVPQFTFADPFAAPGVPGAVNLSGSLSPRLRNAYTMQYSLTVEREVLRDLGVRLSYIGSKGTQLVYQRNVSQPPASTLPFSAARRPYPLFNLVNYSDNGANSLYSGLQAQVSKRFSQGLFLSSTWIWAKQLSDVDDTNNADLNTAVQDAYNRRADRSNSYSVPRHQWMNQLLYELPLARKNRWIGGWQVNVLLNLSTGHFLNPQWPGADTTGTAITSGRPDLVRPLTYPKTLGAWYDRTAFARPPDGRFGNAARNSVVGPGYVIFNAGLSKSFRVEGAGTWQLGASFQNAANHVNFGQPNMTVNNAAGGTITSTHIFPAAGSARTGLLSLRWMF